MREAIKILAVLTIGVVAGRASKKFRVIVTDLEDNLLADVNSNNAIFHKDVLVTVNNKKLT